MITHEHPSVAEQSRSTIRRLMLSLGITFVFVIAEVLAGIFANSLALLTDAAHNLTDVLALALTGWAFWITNKPAHAGKTFGYHRAGILVALGNSTTLVLISLGIFYEAYQRFIHPPDVKADILIWVGLLAVVVNLVTALLVRRGSEHDLNLKSAFLHLMGDVLSTVGAVIAGVIIRFTGLNWFDPLVSVLIGLLILWNAVGILRESVEILMESTPAKINTVQLQTDILAIPGVCGLHDLHIWSITSGLYYLSAHIIIQDVTLSAGEQIQAAVSRMLYEKHMVQHATLQLECGDCGRDDIFCNCVEVH